MNGLSAQERVDEVRAVSLQRHVLTVLATALPPAACVLAAAVSSEHRTSTVLLVVIGFLALVSAIQPDGHLPLVTIVAVVGYWIAVVPDRASPWSMAVAALLYLFHTATALMAMTPGGATIDRATLRRYAARSGVIALTLAATWGIVELFADRHARGSAVLTAAAVVVIIAAAIAIRALSLGSPPPPEDAKPVR